MSGFAAQLRFVRETYGLSIARVAQMVGRDVATVTSWERGTAEPTGRDIPRLRGSLPTLAPYLRRTTTPPRLAAGTMVKTINVADALKPFKPATFSEMLKQARVAAELSTAELGDLVGVAGDAIDELEAARGAVDAGVYEALIDLFPDLRMAAKPALLDASSPPSPPRSLPGVPAQFLPPRAGPPPGTDAPTKPIAINVAADDPDTFAGKLQAAVKAREAEARSIVEGMLPPIDAILPVFTEPQPSLADRWAAALLAHRRAVKRHVRLLQEVQDAAADAEKARAVEEHARLAVEAEADEKAGAP